MEVSCEKPTIILNPNIKDIILKYKNYTFKGSYVQMSPLQVSKYYYDFPWSTFSPKKVSREDIDNCFVFSLDNGEPIPMYYEVPCGKCVICREKKANEWACRAMCESQTSMSIPYFVTLTYNNRCRPKEGVVKKHVQDFLKRFRINVERYCGFETNIRFYACAEYGKQTKLPHYHLLIFNLPLLMANHVQDLVQKSWSYMISKQTADNIPSRLDKYGRPIYKYFDDVANRWRALYGYIHTQISTEGRCRYAMKYMRKDADVPEGKNDVFFLSSRRGGLGSKWIEQHIEEYRNNPEIINVEFTDIWSGQYYKGILPRFFKDKICPTLSRVIKKPIRDLWKKYEYLLNKMSAVIAHPFHANPIVREKYKHLPLYVGVYSKNYEVDSKLYYYSPKVKRNKITKYDYDCVNSRALAKVITSVEKLLLSYHFDSSILDFTPRYKLLRERYLTDYISTQPSVDVPTKKWNIMRNRRIASYREYF